MDVIALGIDGEHMARVRTAKCAHQFSILDSHRQWTGVVRVTGGPPDGMNA